jgi:hypothetical protein
VNGEPYGFTCPDGCGNLVSSQATGRFAARSPAPTAAVVTMSERTAPALTRLDALLACLRSQADTPDRARLLEEASALRRAVDAFHMEAIRFRMFSVERLLPGTGDSGCQLAFDELRKALEAAGFHTRSHAAPPKSAQAHDTAAG